VLRDKTETFAVKKTVAAVEDDMVTIESITEEDDSVVKLLNNIILTAVSKKASDIHIEIQNAALIIKYRIDGILHQIMEPLDCSFHPFLMTRLKVISELDIAEKRVPQDGRFRMRFKQKTIDFRVSIMPGIYGENAVIRILDREMITENIGELKLKQLGFAPYILEKINYYIRQPYGLFLVTGPTGSGKTTTLYAALNEIKDPADKIITIEDPVEYQVDGIIQIPVNEKKGLTCAMIRTRSWSARSATRKPPRSPSSRPSPAIWCLPLCTPTTFSMCWAASSTWGSTRTALSRL
jgi:type II secretory ATPase GspE/PulE/Tfp pilus assembly ATPase PilB-like protein